MIDNGTLAPLLSVILTVYVPAPTLPPITNDAAVMALGDALSNVHAPGEVTSPAVVDVIVQVVAADENPEPVIVIVVPAGPS